MLPSELNIPRDDGGGAFVKEVVGMVAIGRVGGEGVRGGHKVDVNLTSAHLHHSAAPTHQSLSNTPTPRHPRSSH